MNLAALSLPVVVAALALAAAWLVAAALLPLWIRAARRSPIVARGALLVAALPWLAGVALVVAALLRGTPTRA